VNLSVAIAGVKRSEHAALQAAIDAAESALVDLEHGRRSNMRRRATPAPAPVSGRRWAGQGTPTAPPERPPRTFSTLPIRRSWDELKLALERHLVREALELHPRVVLATLDPKVPGLVEELYAEHEVLRDGIRQLRPTLLGADAVRREFDDLFSAFEAHARREDVELYPAIVSKYASGSDGLVVHDRYRTSDDVARSLRASLPPSSERPPRKKPRRGWWGRLLSQLGL
jgi:hypothetical protein